MICKKWKQLMNYISGSQNGGYYKCNKCNTIDFK